MEKVACLSFQASCISFVTFEQDPLMWLLCVFLLPSIPSHVFSNSLFVWRSFMLLLSRLPYLFSLSTSLSICLTLLPLLLLALPLSLSLLPWVMEHIVPSFRLHELLARSAFSCCFFFFFVQDCSWFFSKGGMSVLKPHDFSQ